MINDDMQKLYDALEQADALVLGSPVYMGQMSAQAKIVTDRLFARFSPRFSPYFKEGNAKKKLILVLTWKEKSLSIVTEIHFWYCRVDKGW
ncbi:flavodoxin family protein [Sporomusa sp.]|uniref:flavodoxin family protein n=1 Tax=Sporomusa sp. TaxID=2078658 RepID=UPI002CF333D1|nr:NAD(P)H-dependent oxidoreductase [Sporomusa sp.]HWR08254.1 NAD(P)H-dependent oxidoreductase [Sporomusa sp.]